MGRDKAANTEGRELNALLNEAWDEEGARCFNGSNADSKTSSSPCAVSGVKRAQLGQAGE